MASGTKIVLILAVLLVGTVGGYFALVPESSSEPEVTAKNTNTVMDTISKTKTADSSNKRNRIPGEFTNKKPGGILGDAVGDILASQNTNSDKLKPVETKNTKPVVINPPLGRKLVEDGGKDVPYLVDPKTLKDDSKKKDVRPSTPAKPKLKIKPAPKYKTYYVKSGDTMTSIAKAWFGNGTMWDLIAKANPYVDPNKLIIGQKLRMPAHDTIRDTPTAPATGSASVYVVKSGDNLTRIAKAVYKDSEKWALIYEANRKLIGSDPNNLRVGMKLTIPPFKKRG